MEKPATVICSCGHQVAFMCVSNNPRTIADRIANKSARPCSACRLAYDFEAALVDKGCELLVQRQNTEESPFAIGDAITIVRQKSRWVGRYKCKKVDGKSIEFKFAGATPENVAHQLLEAITYALREAQELAETIPREALPETS